MNINDRETTEKCIQIIKVMYALMGTKPLPIEIEE